MEKYVHYLIGERDVEEDSEIKEDDMSELISHATKVIEAHTNGEKVSIPTSSEDIEEVRMTGNETIIEPAKEPEQIIELEFIEDSDDESDDESSLEEGQRLWTDLKATKTSLNYRKDNSVPPSIGELDIMRGIIYYCISLTDFYKKVGTLEFETEIVTIYDVLNENDKSIREDRLERIGTLVEELVKKSKTEVESYEKRESEIRESILSLSFLLDKIEGLRVTSSGPEIEKVYMQTRSAIYDANIDLLKAKEMIDDFLESIEHTIEGYIGESL